MAVAVLVPTVSITVAVAVAVAVAVVVAAEVRACHQLAGVTVLTVVATVTACVS